MSGRIRVTGLGSWPGSDLAASLRLTFGEVADLPYLPELPARGVGSDLIGRTGAVLEGLSLDLQPAGWRLTDGAGIDARRAWADWRRDLDLLEEAAQGYSGPFKLALAGPWTMAACLEKPRGDKVLADHGARRDLAEALAAGAAALFVELGRRLPESDLVLQVDEPLLPAVSAGRIRTASGFSRFRSVDRPELSEALTRVVGAVAAASSVLHCCGRGADPSLVYGAGFDTIALDARHLDRRMLDLLGGPLESGRNLWLGIARTDLLDQVPRPDSLASAALGHLRPLELGRTLLDRVWLTPACGLAGWGVQPATRLLRVLHEAAELVTEQLSA